MISTDDFRQELLAQMERAASRGQKTLVINALELHVAFGVFPGPGHTTASDVMELEMKAGDVLLVERNSPAGLTIRYLLPRLR